jgi:hypothetical protein
MHGFALPFSLVRATLADTALRRPYLRLLGARACLALVLTAATLHTERYAETASTHAIPSEDASDDDETPQGINVLGHRIDVVKAETSGTHGTHEVAPPRGRWRSIGAFFGALAFIEALLVFVSRTYDDALSFHVARLADTRPEEETPKAARLSLDLRWLYRKVKRRFRGTLVFAAGVPLLALLHLTPWVGRYVFSAALTVWAWYWLAVFSAAKSAHAWAPPVEAHFPAPLRLLDAHVPEARWTAPVRLYTRIWRRLTRDVNPVVTTFERSPLSFLGLALARALFTLPLLYLVGRPVLSVAAGRLCAEFDPRVRAPQA